MHICFITASMVGGGTERVIAVLANYFAKQKKKVTILMTASDKIEYELDSAVQVLQIGKQTEGKLLGRLQRIRKLQTYLKMHKNTRFLSFGTETNMFAILAALCMNRTVIISERNDPNKCTFPKKRDFLYRFASRYVFQTEDAMNCFSEKIRKKSIVIPNPVSDKVPDRFIGERRKEIVAVGRLEEQKNHRLLLEAYADFHKKVSEYTLKIYGKGYLKQELENYAVELGIEECVCFADFAPDVLERIRDSAMYVLSSDYEGISNSLLEALAMGLPVISTNCPIGGSRMVIRNYVNGILVPVGDRQALAEAMVELAQDKALADRLSEAASKLKEDYAVDKIANMWEKIL